MLEGVLSEGACRVLADLCSFGGALPTGAPTSPAIANLILRSADAAITKAAEANGITYTRYADDLTFSGESNVLKLLPFVEKVLGQLGYQLDPKKTNIFRRGRRQMVTGLVVNDKPNLPRRIRRRLRAAVHRQSSGEEAHWHGRPMSKDELTGRLSHLQLVQPEEAVALKRKLKGAPPDQNGAQDS
jgi:retron-type reverse transcriptase